MFLSNAFLFHPLPVLLLSPSVMLVPLVDASTSMPALRNDASRSGERLCAADALPREGDAYFEHHVHAFCFAASSKSSQSAFDGHFLGKAVFPCSEDNLLSKGDAYLRRALETLNLCSRKSTRESYSYISGNGSTPSRVNSRYSERPHTRYLLHMFFLSGPCKHDDHAVTSREYIDNIVKKSVRGTPAPRRICLE